MDRSLMIAAALLIAVATTAIAADAPPAKPRASGAAVLASDAPDVAVVCPEEFHTALAPWLAHRRQQGRRIVLLSNAGTQEQIRGELESVAARGSLAFVVLVGDADPAAERDAALRKRCVPTQHVASKVGVKWGSEKALAADNFYADLDAAHDGAPDVAIGRLTADNPQQLALIVKKIIAYENSTDMGLWRRKVNFVAGVGGFGALADTIIETGAKLVITDGVPPCYATTMTYGSWQSPYCPAPSQFQQATLDRLNEGSLFWVYIGHGQRRYLDTIQVPGKRYPIMSVGDIRRMKSAAGSPIALFLACYTGAFDEPQDCIAEEMLRAEGAPIAAICGSRVTMPYAMAVMGSEMMQECFVRRRATVGEIVMYAKRSMLDAKGTAPNRALLDSIAAAVSPKGVKPADERAEHVQLFNLIGDPLLRLPQSAALTLEGPKFANPGDEIEVSGGAPCAGSCTLELIVRRDRIREAVPGRARYEETSEAIESYNAAYRMANDPVLATEELKLAAGAFKARLKIPANAEGPCHLRAFVAGEKSSALGACDIYIRRGKAKRP
jgi:hypothetical protein